MSVREANKTKCCLLTDFGSTFTKVSLVDLDEEKLLGQASAFTTITTSVLEGFTEALGQLQRVVDLDRVDIVSRLACSSAGGGLKLIAIGLAPDFTVEAARRAALGAGARILKSYSYYLDNEDLAEIEALAPDIILLSGGENGGNKKCIIANAAVLANLSIPVPIIVAGNIDAKDQIDEIFTSAGKDYYFTENVMPSVNHLNVDPVRGLIRQIFMEQIIKANGMKDVEGTISNVIMPTPTAVLVAAELLAKGAGKYPGLGDVMVVDIGGATTDIHSVSAPIQDQSLFYDGLEEPGSKRTVEGDLGMRYSALSLLESLGEASFLKYGNETGDIKAECIYRTLNPNFVPEDQPDKDFDEVIAKNCVETATLRHSGTVRRSYLNGRNVMVQSGKDLRNIKYVIGTGGVIVNSAAPYEILKCSVLDRDCVLAPTEPSMILDKEYLLAAMGLLSSHYPAIAFRILTDNLLTLKPLLPENL